MGLFSFIKGELIDVVSWEDNTADTMVHKFEIPEKQQITNGAQLIVRPSQVAIFVYEGQIADIYQPGKHTLTTDTMPVITTLKNWKYGFDSPFKTDVYFVNTKQFINNKWGTSKPVMMRDQDFGILRIRGFGKFSYSVHKPTLFLTEVMGSSRFYTTSSVEDHLKTTIVSCFSDLIAESNIPAIDLAMNYDELSELGLSNLSTRFDQYGLELQDFIIENISLPDSVEKAIDKRSEMGALGNLDQYAKYQSAEAIRDAAQNTGGGFASMGAGLAAGQNIGATMMNSMNNNSQPQQGSQNQQNTSQVAQGKTTNCPKCNASVGADSKFCPECGNGLAYSCIECKKTMDKNMKFCPECGANQNPTINCSKCNAELTAGAKFCPECGEKND